MIQTNRQLRRLVSAITVIAFIAPTAASGVSPLAESIPIANAGFEDDPVAMGCFAVFTPNAWTVYDPNGIIGGNDVVGGLHPEGGPYFPAAPEGDHVAIVFLQGDIGGGPMGLTQVLDDVLEVNTMYTLSAWVGNIASGQGPPPCDVFGFFNLDGFPGYQIQLLAGGVVIGQDDNSLAGTIPEGEFRLSSFEVDIGPAHPQAGELLEVRLINLNMIDTPEAPGIEVDFDDVQLVRGCPATGDLNNDKFIDTADVVIFVDMLLEVDTDPVHVDRADVNCSDSPDGNDVLPFVCILLE